MLDEFLVIPVGRQRQGNAPFSSGISLDFIHKVGHLHGVHSACATDNRKPPAANVSLSHKELTAVVIVPVLLFSARVLFHALEPHPHECVLADGAGLGLALDGDGIDAVAELGA